MLDVFNNYLQNFDLTEPNIMRKVKHSKQVKNLIRDLAKKLGWSEEDILICEQIGFLHDIGRFQEWKEKGSYVGLEFDHGDFGVKLLQENDLYKEFGITEEHKAIVFNAIYYHNKFEIPEENNDKYLKIIRDADKLENLMKLSNDETFYNYISKVFQGNVISDKVKESFNNEKSVNVKDVESLMDYYILILAFIFDINYDISIEIIKEEAILEKFARLIPNQEIFEKYLKEAHKYIERRLENAR